jgi:hypothetical protein
MPDIKNLKDLYSQLKLAVVGTNTQKIDAKLDAIIKDINSYRSHSGRNGYIELVKSVIGKADVKLGGGGGSLFSQGMGPAAFGQGGRLLRYKTYQAIVSNINYCHRALNVLVDNILSPDDITKISLDIRATDYLGETLSDEEEETSEGTVRRVKEIIKRLKLEEQLPLVVRNTLLFGDFFCEVTDAVRALTTQSLLTESQKEELLDSQKGDSIKEVISEKIQLDPDDKKTITDFQFTIDYTSLQEKDENDFKLAGDDIIKSTDGTKIKIDPGKNMKLSLANVKLVYHEPQFVLKLQSALFPICFGYLIFPKMAVVPGAAIADEAVNNVCIQILKSLQAKLPQMKQFKGTKELRDIIKYMVSQSDQNRSLEIRYVPPNKMIHFMVPSTKYYPYGESIFDSGQYMAKVLIALETALAIQRLSRSTEKRKIAIEVGLPRDAKNAIEGMKEEFRKRKVSLDSFGTVDTIPSMLTTFEDVYIPQKDGKPFVDISTFNEGNVDIRSKVDELKFMRDQLVAGLGIPPSFLGIEENLSNKAALSEENILFARAVISHQKYLTHQLNELLDVILNILGSEDTMEDVYVSLPPPRSLQYEREARYMQEVTGLIQSLEGVGVPKSYSRKKYLTNIDWDEVEKHETDETIEKTLDPSKKQEEEGMGGMGGFGGGMGGATF